MERTIHKHSKRNREVKAMEIQSGTVRKEKQTITIKDYKIRQIIITALLREGYDLQIKPNINPQGQITSEELTINEIEIIKYHK